MKNYMVIFRGVLSGDRVGFGQVSFGSVVFRIGYFSVACYVGHTRVGSVSHSLVEDRLFELSG